MKSTTKVVSRAKPKLKPRKVPRILSSYGPPNLIQLSDATITTMGPGANVTFTVVFNPPVQQGGSPVQALAIDSTDTTGNFLSSTVALNFTPPAQFTRTATVTVNILSTQIGHLCALQVYLKDSMGNTLASTGAEFTP